MAALPTLDTLAGLPTSSYALLFMLAVVHTTLAFALYTFGLGRLGAGRAAIVATVEPVVAGALGTVLLGEESHRPQGGRGALVVSGAVLAQVSRSADAAYSASQLFGDQADTKACRRLLARKSLTMLAPR